MMKNDRTVKRWYILATGVFAMLFAGVLYAWSVLKVPFSAELGISQESLSLNFTLTMSCFCIGGVISGRLVKLLGTKAVIALSGVLAGAGFVLTGFVDRQHVWMLYLSYAVISGFGIGVAYITVISTVNAWFPDRKGLSSGALMMGFGASSLLVGNAAEAMFASALGWRGAYAVLGVALSAVLILAAVVVKKPKETDGLPAPKGSGKTMSEPFLRKEYTPGEMLRRFTFWRAFLCMVCLTAVGNSVISFARDLAVHVGAEGTLATTLVGVLAVFNGLGRILTGAVFDVMGRKFTMIAANGITIVSAATILLALRLSSLPLCVIGLCMTGISYGSAPTVASAFVVSFYGQKHFATNLGMMNFNLMAASFIATACSALLTATGQYVAPFILLLTLSVIALGLNFSIKKP